MTLKILKQVFLCPFATKPLNFVIFILFFPYYLCQLQNNDNSIKGDNVARNWNNSIGSDDNINLFMMLKILTLVFLCLFATRSPHFIIFILLFPDNFCQVQNFAPVFMRNKNIGASISLLIGCCTAKILFLKKMFL